MNEPGAAVRRPAAGRRRSAQRGSGGHCRPPRFPGHGAHHPSASVQRRLGGRWFSSAVVMWCHSSWSFDSVAKRDRPQVHRPSSITNYGWPRCPHRILSGKGRQGGGVSVHTPDIRTSSTKLHRHRCGHHRCPLPSASHGPSVGPSGVAPRPRRGRQRSPRTRPFGRLLDHSQLPLLCSLPRCRFDIHPRLMGTLN